MKYKPITSSAQLTPGTELHHPLKPGRKYFVDTKKVRGGYPYWILSIQWDENEKSGKAGPKGQVLCTLSELKQKYKLVIAESEQKPNPAPEVKNYYKHFTDVERDYIRTANGGIAAKND